MSDPTVKVCNKFGESKPTSKYDKGRGTCRQCRYSGTRRQKRIDAARTYRASNPSAIRERNRAYYLQNAEEIKANYRENPHLRWASEYRRRMKRLGLTPGFIQNFTTEDVVREYGDACHYCGGEFAELDHAIPLAMNGPHTLANVRPSCRKCNRSKGSKVAS